tara:strand:- start:213 stop:887 length:675 start_codon:yes stop_codon:yes gene_type:complete
MKDLTLIIPAKNEKESLPKVLKELKNYDYNINVILEKNDIDTIESIKEFNCEIIYQINKGYGDALIQGIKQTKTDFFCIFNADGSFDPKEIHNMLNKVRMENFDFIFASRYLKNAKSDDDTIITLVGNKIFSFIGKIFFSLPISDILYTFVLGKTKKAQSLNLKQKDFTFCIELPIKAKRNNYKLGSSVSHERSRIAGFKKVNAFKDGTLILIHMIKLFFNKSK